MIKRPRWLERRLRDRLTERKYYSAMDHWTQHWETARYCTNPALLPRKKRILSYSRIVEPTRGSTRIYFIMSIFLTHVNIFDAFRRPSSMRGILKGKKLILVQVSTQRCREPTRMSFFYLEGENETEKNETCSFFFSFKIQRSSSYFLFMSDRPSAPGGKGLEIFPLSPSHGLCCSVFPYYFDLSCWVQQTPVARRCCSD